MTVRSGGGTMTLDECPWRLNLGDERCCWESCTNRAVWVVDIRAHQAWWSIMEQRTWPRLYYCAEHPEYMAGRTRANTDSEAE